MTLHKTLRVLLLAAAAVISACASDVKLDEVPVEDRTGQSQTPAPAPAPAGTGTPATQGGAGIGQSAPAGVSRGPVAPVDLGAAGTATAGPQGVARIIYFDYDSDAIKPEFQAVVDAHARHLKVDPKRRIVVEGHTDERGGREYNLALGQRRAEAIRRALGLLGVADAQVEAVSFGKEKPAARGSDEASFARNRRAELAYR